ncbi:MAG: hypothetical protein KatS3mg031_1140 [Chitinophagales bacterium]|nr:MAG: hypothetical protein KatS3mg031_1140 [Chitinophagales bacterium]
MQFTIAARWMMVLFLVWTLPSEAQVQRCHTDEYMQQLKQSDPGLESRIQQAREQTRHFLSQSSSQKTDRSAVITIPVVVHVMHHGEPVGTGTNISDAQILSQIEVLNEDYQGLNADLTKVPAHFSNVIGIPNIEFCLAQLDPQGQPTTGINRVNIGSASWSDNLKPGTIWDATRYLNIWVTEISGGVLGYTTFPGSNLSQDGVVIDYRYFGKAPYNSYNSKFNLGRTATHEIGHWLDLDHTFENGCSGGTPSTCSSAGDRMCDTPPTANANYGCAFSTTRNTCTESPVDNPDMWMNYMDYMDDACLYMFTQDQANWMRAVLNSSRSGILLSPACNNQSLFAYTGRVIDAVTGSGVPFAKILFKGGLTYEITADGAGYFNHPAFREDTYAIYAGKWGYQTRLFSASLRITAGSPALTIPIDPGYYYDDFIMGYGWTSSGSASTGLWERGVPIQTSYNGETSNPGEDVPDDFGESCYVTGNAGGSAGNDDVDDGDAVLRSPIFNLSSYHDPYLSYYRWFFNGGGQGNPDDQLIISLSNGITTAVIETIDASTPFSNQWNGVKVRIKDFIIPTSTMQFIITAEDRGAGHLVEAALDKFEITDSLPTAGPHVPAVGIIAFPNPASDVLAVKINGAIGRAQLLVTDVSGRVFRNMYVAEHASLTLEVSSLPAGLYFLKLKDTQATVVRKIFIFR